MTTESSNRRNLIIAAVALLLALGAGIYLSVVVGRNHLLDEDLKKEKLTSESLLSEKLALEKEIDKLKTEYLSLDEKNKSLAGEADRFRNRWQESEQRIKTLQRENQSVAQLKKQVQELTQMKEAFEKQIAQLKDSNRSLQSANDDLMKTVALLQDQNKQLKTDLLSAQFTSLNNTLIESAKKNGRLTATAKRTRKLNVTVEVPEEADKLSFKIINPDGSVVPAESSDITMGVVKSEVKKSQAFYSAAHADTGKTIQRVTMTYAPKARLKSGLYQIEVLNASESIGFLQVRLR